MDVGNGKDRVMIDSMQIKSSGKKFLSPKELADMLNVDITTVYGWTAMRNIPFHKFNRKLVRFDVSEIESWLKKNKVPAKSFA